MRIRGVGRSLCEQAFGAGEVGGAGAAHFEQYAFGVRVRQPEPRLGRPRVERQCPLQKGDRLGRAVARRRFRQQRAPPENIIQRIGVGGRAGGLGADQRTVERDRDAAGDLVLQGEEVAHLAVEPLGPQMRVGCGVNQLGVDADLIARAAQAPLQHIAHAELAADLLCLDRPAR